MEIIKMKLKTQKKAQIFTLIAIAILFLFFVTYELYTILNERQAVRIRIRTMDAFLFSLEQDIERQLYTSGFRIIFLAEDHIASTGTYIENFTELFNEAIHNGTIYGEYENKSDILEGVNISAIQESIQERATKINVEVNFSKVDVRIGQEDPWHIIVYFNATLNLTDKTDLASWYKNETVKSYISIENFEDPLYLLNTNGLVSRKIFKTPYEGKYVAGSNITNLSLHVTNKYYAENPKAPSFIMRLEGRDEEDENGIESFVYLPDLSAQGIQTKEKTCIDYIYFSTSSPDSYKVEGMPSWFRIDGNHTDKYQVSNLTY
jgi:hypothetical protein